ncbi:MAG TPA: hypothetical protein VLM37_11385, partial [Fibrobacteraceae bacterium]|nr:hypothetical protein [Fibrobacteraceae bacterium]
MRKMIAVLMRLQGDVVLVANGTASLVFHTDTLSLQGRDASDSTKEEQLDSALAFIYLANLHFSSDSAKAKAERLPRETQNEILFAFDFQSFQVGYNCAPLCQNRPICHQPTPSSLLIENCTPLNG